MINVERQTDRHTDTNKHIVGGKYNGKNQREMKKMEESKYKESKTKRTAQTLMEDICTQIQ